MTTPTLGMPYWPAVPGGRECPKCGTVVPTPGTKLTPEVYAHVAAHDLAARIAADVVATAEQYPAIRGAADFGELHDIYDANESILAAFEILYGDLQAVFDHDGDGGGLSQKFTDEANAATAEVDDVLRASGFEGLEALARSVDR